MKPDRQIKKFFSSRYKVGITVTSGGKKLILKAEIILEQPSISATSIKISEPQASMVGILVWQKSLIRCPKKRINRFL